MPLVENPQPIREMDIDWGAYRIAMLQDSAYQRVTALTTDQRSVGRIETFFAIEAEQWPIAIALWEQMITGCPDEAMPTAAEAVQWENIASTNAMPISFDESGAMRIRAA